VVFVYILTNSVKNTREIVGLFCTLVYAYWVKVIVEIIMLSRFYGSYRPYVSTVWLAILMLSMLSACGGGGSSSKSSGSTANTMATSSRASAQSSSPSGEPLDSSSSSSLASVAIIDPVTLSGSVTYDFVPHNNNQLGLNYNAIREMPVRGAVVQLLNSSGTVIAADNTDSNGAYSFNAPKNTRVKVRVKAQLLKTTSPTWDFKVTDNTSNYAVYVLDGSLTSTGSINSQRNLHAVSGWDGFQYSIRRTAAPFAILDDIYIGAMHLSASGNTTNLPPLELRWSTKNNAANGDERLGEIGTSYFDGSSIYVLGDADNDTDEYDSHVIVHEWGHYLEQNLFRADSFGGNHTDGDKLDMRVAMSEGFANGFASIMLDDPYYSDASGYAQNSGFFLDISSRNRTAKGFYSEGSIGSIFYNYYVSSNNKTANDFSTIFSVLSDSKYITNDAMTSIFLFYEHLNTFFSDQAVEFNALMQEQNIFGTNTYGDDETNNAGYASSLPLYKTILPDGTLLNVCSSAEFGKYNKLANSQLVKLTIPQEKLYTVSAIKFGGASVTSQPEFIIFKRGESIKYVNNTVNDFVSDSVSLAEGVYIIEVFDAKNRDEYNTQHNTTCFNLRVSAN